MFNKTICTPPCKHKKCECGHCRDYHEFNKYNCDQLDRETLMVCGCKGFKKAASKIGYLGHELEAHDY